MIIGHKQQKERLEKSLETGNFFHAYLFSGPERVGKFLLAELFAMGLIGGKKIKEIETEIQNKKSDAMVPDLLILEPETDEKKGVIKKKNIEVESIRDKQKELSLFPYIGKVRVLIINDAHKMTISSQNALLKTLEEPNGTSVIILVTHREGKMLSTIKSRCQRIKFGLVDDDEIIDYSKENNKELIALSMGRPGIFFDSKKDENDYEKRLDMMRKIISLKNMNSVEKMSLAEQLAKDASVTVVFLEMLLSFFHKQGSGYDSRQIEKSGMVQEAMFKIEDTNTNNRLVLENLFLHF